MLIACVSPRPAAALSQLATALRYDPLLLQRLVSFVDVAPSNPPPLVILDPEGPITLPRIYSSGAVTIAGLADAPAAIGALGGLLPRAAAPGLHGRLGARHADAGAVLELLAPDLPLPPVAVWQPAATAVRRLRPFGADGLDAWWRGDPTIDTDTRRELLGAAGHWSMLRGLVAPACAVCGPMDPAELLRVCAESRLRGESPRPITARVDRPPERVAFYLCDDVDAAAVDLVLTAWRIGSAVELRRLGAVELPDALSFFLDPQPSPLLQWLPERATLVSVARLLYPETLL